MRQLFFSGLSTNAYIALRNARTLTELPQQQEDENKGQEQINHGEGYQRYGEVRHRREQASGRSASFLRLNLGSTILKLFPGSSCRTSIPNWVVS